MPSALIDAAVAGRLALRSIGRRLRGEISRPPDTEAFRRQLEAALGALGDQIVASHTFIFLPAKEPPWRETGLDLAPGEEVTWLAVGRVYASRPLDIWVGPRNQLWARVGKDGVICSSTRDTCTLVAEQGGPLYFGNYFPNDWKDESGARLQDDSVYDAVDGGTGIVLIRWAGSARAGLEALRTLADPHGLVSGELERLVMGDSTPPGWRYLWHLGQAEIFRAGRDAGDGPVIDCSVRGDVGILQKEVDLPLTPGTKISWHWKIDALPGLMREDSMPSHDYLSIAVEFDDGRDITYYWSRSLPPETGYVCPLPNWKHKEFHVVVRQGEQGLGDWHAETRDLHADYARYMGDPPSRIVRVWLIANSIFARQLGQATFTRIHIEQGGQGTTVL